MNLETLTSSAQPIDLAMSALFLWFADDEFNHRAQVITQVTDNWSIPAAAVLAGMPPEALMIWAEIDKKPIAEIFEATLSSEFRQVAETLCKPGVTWSVDAAAAMLNIPADVLQIWLARDVAGLTGKLTEAELANGEFVRFAPIPRTLH